MISDDVVLAVAPGDSPILSLRKQKLRIGGVRITLVCGNQFFIVRFFGILRVGYPRGQTLRDDFAFVPVQGYDSSRCYRLHLVFYLALLFLLKYFAGYKNTHERRGSFQKADNYPSF